GRAGARAENDLAESVLRVGLLPQRVWMGGDAEGTDLSGLGAGRELLSPTAVPDFDEAGTDGMRLVRRRVKMPGGHNRPSLGGADVSPADHAGEVLAGFEQVYRTLLRHRDELLAGDGPLARFVGDEVRVVLRATQTYGALLHESFHPDLLREALD